MRPSLLLIALTSSLAALTVLLIVMLRDGGTLLLVLWGALAGVVMLDLFGSVPSRSLELETDLPSDGFVGLNAPLSLKIGRIKGTLPKHMDLRLSLSEGLIAPENIMLEAQTGIRETSISVPLLMHKRGEHAVTAIHLRFASRFGFFEIMPFWSTDLKILAQPNIQPVLSGEIQTQMMSVLDGQKSFTLKGEGAEFHQLRDFVPGMDPRAIDWKRSARMHELLARETRVERNHQIMVCVDRGHLMAEKIGKLSKLDHAINAALALSWAGVLGGDRVGCYTFGPRPGDMVPPDRGRSSFARIRSTLSKLEQDDTETNHTLAMMHLHGFLNRRTLVVVISDFVDSVTAELLIENMAILARQNLVLYVTMRDSALDRLSHPNTFSMESISMAVSATRIKQERAVVQDKLRRLGVHCLDTSPETLTPDLVSRYVDIKLQGYM